MADLSIFIDESGDVGTESKYYLITLLLHDQALDINPYESSYRESLRQRRLPDHPMHLSPLLNGNDQYRYMDVEERKRLLSAFRVLLQYLPFKYKTISYKKSELFGPGKDIAAAQLIVERHITQFLQENLALLQKYDNVKVYYDNGQSLVTQALRNAVKSALAKDAVFFRDAAPNDYRLSQVADYACTMELAALKYEAKEQSSTEELFFGNRRRFTKDFLGKLRKHSL